MIVANPASVRPVQTRMIELPVGDPALLLFDWLTELLYAFESDKLLLSEFDVQLIADKLLATAADVGGAKIIVGEIPEAPTEHVQQQVDRLRQKAVSAVVVLGWPADGKVSLLAAVTDDLVKKGLHAGKLVGQVAAVVGGKGGGKPTMAQDGGKEPEKLGEALELAKKLAGEQLGAK